MNRIREALGDKASHPRFIETLAVAATALWRRWSRSPCRKMIAADPRTEISEEPAAVSAGGKSGSLIRFYQAGGFAEELSLRGSDTIVLLQLMYLGFYVGALSTCRNQRHSRRCLMQSDIHGPDSDRAALIPVRTFLLCAVLSVRRGCVKVSQALATAPAARYCVGAFSVSAAASHQLRVGAGLHDAAGLLSVRSTVVILMARAPWSGKHRPSPDNSG